MITKRNDFIIYARKAGSGFVFAVVLVVEADGSDDAAVPNLEPITQRRVIASDVPGGRLAGFFID